MPESNIGIIGAGSIATALAKILGERGYSVTMWARREEVIRSINEDKENADYFPGIKLSSNVRATASLEECTKSDVLFLSVPSHAIKETCTAIRNLIGNSNPIIVSVAKGINYPTFKRLSELIREILGEDIKLAIMSGPNFASEIVRGLLSGTTIASYDRNVLKTLKSLLHSENFIVQTSDDVIGVELSGSLKNVYAIAMGILDAIGINENAYYFILTEAFREMKDIITRLGGRVETLFLSSGFGDLYLTSNSDKSRNRVLGFIAGKEMLGNTDTSSVILEGIKSVRAFFDRTNRWMMKFPVLEFVYNVVILRQRPHKEFLKLWKQIKEMYDD